MPGGVSAISLLKLARWKWKYLYFVAGYPLSCTGQAFCNIIITIILLLLSSARGIMKHRHYNSQRTHRSLVLSGIQSTKNFLFAKQLVSNQHDRQTTRCQEWSALDVDKRLTDGQLRIGDSFVCTVRTWPLHVPEPCILGTRVSMTYKWKPHCRVILSRQKKKGQRGVDFIALPCSQFLV